MSLIVESSIKRSTPNFETLGKRRKKFTQKGIRVVSSFQREIEILRNSSKL